MPEMKVLVEPFALNSVGGSGVVTGATTGPIIINAVLDGATAVTVNAVIAATGTARYSAAIVATKIG